MNLTKKVKAGVIGVGYLGKFHAQKYARLEGVEFVGVVDVDPAQAAKVAATADAAPLPITGSFCRWLTPFP